MEETMQQENNLAIEKEEETTVEIELPTEGVEENVEVVEEEADSDPKSEQEEYSDSVQKRINKLTYKLRETERQNEEAVTWAQKVQEENAKLKKKADTANSAMFTEYDNRVKTELESAKAEYKDAYDRGDTDSIVNANEKLSRLSVESESLRRVSAKRKQADEDGVEIPVTDTVIPASPNPQPAQPDPMAQQWAEKNQWFGKDQGLTFAAFGIHRELMDEGYDGTTNDYYKELDNRLSNFGNRNYTDNEQVLDSPVQRVASPSRQARTTNARSKKIKLTQSQVAIAKKLGVPLEEYAKYVKQ
tara:strand:+ start:6453 stop:7358 length:906 start_codon:yes stop_codon:yes gene_type:complete